MKWVIMASFKGTYSHILEPKNRISIPSKMRNSFIPEDSNTLIMTRGFEQCIYIYPFTEWKKLEDKIRTLSVMDSDTRKFIRLILGHAQEYECDKQGRIVLPQNLLTYANIEKDVIIIGMLNWMEVWNPALYEQTHQSFDLEKTAEKMMIF
jgi:MraZ protein